MSADSTEEIVGLVINASLFQRNFARQILCAAAEFNIQYKEKRGWFSSTFAVSGPARSIKTLHAFLASGCH